MFDRDRRNDWRFEPSDSGWVWFVNHPDGRVEHSLQSFPTLETCMADAKRYGYVPWSPEAERRGAREDVPTR